MRPMTLALCALTLSAQAAPSFKLPDDNHAFLQIEQPQGATFELTLGGDEIALRDGKIHCEPGTRVRRAYYIHYVFEAAAFQAAFPDYAKRDQLTVRGRVASRTLKGHEVPVGHIRVYTVEATLLPNLAPPIYALQATLKAEFDQALIKGIDGITPPYPEGSAYQIGAIPTRPGEGKIYQFQAVVLGDVSYRDHKAPIHYLLMLKVDDSEQIVEGYHYTLEWSDSPSIALYRLTTMGVKLVDGLKLSKLAMVNSEGQALAIDGTIQLIK